MRKATVFVFLFICVHFFEVQAQQSLASHAVVNYAPSDYQAGLQNWRIVQDRSGVMYFANNDGVLTYDGDNWRIYHLPNKTIVRSMGLTPDGRLFVGGQDEIGYFAPDVQGQLHYHSLLDELPQPCRRFADVWTIEVLVDEVYFRTSKYIFRYSDRFSVFEAQRSWAFLGRAGEQLVAQAEDGTLYTPATSKKNGWKRSNHLIQGSTRMLLTAVEEWDEQHILVATQRHGLYIMPRHLTGSTPFPFAASKTPRVSRLRRLASGHIAAATTDEGAYILNRKGDILQHYRQGNGLQKNAVIDLFVDAKQNLWLALDDGIDYLPLTSPLRYIYPDGENRLSGYGTLLAHGNMFIATSDGLYTANIVNLHGEALTDVNHTPFRKVANSDGQVWRIDQIGEEIFVSHEHGGKRLYNGELQTVFDQTGAWVFKPTSLSAELSAPILAGTYDGLWLIAPNQHAQSIGHIGESLRFIHYDRNKNVVWASHPYRGVFRYVLTPDQTEIRQTTHFGEKHGLPSSMHNYLFFIRGKILVATQTGIFEYNTQQDSFVRSVTFTSLESLQIQYMYEDCYANVWFASNKRLGLLDFERPSDTSQFSTIFFPQLDGRIIGGFESVYVFDRNNIFIGIDKGVLHLDYARYLQTQERPKVLLRGVQGIDAAHDEVLLYGGYGQQLKGLLTVDHPVNSFRFSFSAVDFAPYATIEYSYMLEGLEQSWSPWSDRTDREYTQLKPGQYTFKVRSRNGEDNESDIVAFHFEIRPPWYRTGWAGLVYVLLTAAAIFLLFSWQRRRVEKIHKHRIYLQQLELDHKEKELVRLKNEKLEADVNYKNKELVNMTMHLVQRGEILSKIKENLLQMTKKGDAKLVDPNLKQVIRLVRSAERADEDWEQFSRYFNNTFEGFFSSLRKRFPDLTPNDLKLCAYLRMNLSSKEIAQLMNITSKAVEVARYRLRKKLGMSSEEHFHEFLSKFHKKE